MSETAVGPIGWERALMAAEKVNERLRRATKALDAAGVPYAVVGGNAVADWVVRVDDGADRNTRNVDLLVNRADFAAVRTVLERAGFFYQALPDTDAFSDGPQGKPTSGVRVLYAGEKVRVENVCAAPTLDESEHGAEFQVVTLIALARMKLVAWRLIDRVHLRDLMDVGLLDTTWPARFPPTLAARLQELLDDPNG